MNYLLDTNVVSELKRPRPEPRVIQWFTERSAHQLFMSVLTLGEIRKGIQLAPEGQRRSTLVKWLEEDIPDFAAGRLLVIDSHTADRWGRMTAAVRRPMPGVDGLLAATASQHQLTIVTRNVKDFLDWGLPVLNPWEAS